MKRMIVHNNWRKRISKAWCALDRLQIIWKSALPEQINKGFFRAVVESVLFYGSSAWTLTKTLENKLNETYTRMLRAILNIHWSTYPSKERLYGNLVQITSVIKERRTKFADDSYRSKDIVVSDLILWTPKHNKVKVGPPSKTYTNQLQKMLIVNLRTSQELWRAENTGEGVYWVRAIRLIR